MKKTKQPIINLAKIPKLPKVLEGWTIEKHSRGDTTWVFDASQIGLFLTETQKKKMGKWNKHRKGSQKSF